MLRKRSYTSELAILQGIERPGDAVTFMLGYRSDGLSLFARLDLPATAAPAQGFPVVVLAPGWISRERALEWDFAIDGESTTGETIDRLVSAGFAVVTAGYRGRGKVNGVHAHGMEFRDAWGNGSYISPIFYAIDTLNLLAGLGNLEKIDWRRWLPGATSPGFNLDKVSLWGHSQGGDVALTVLTVAGHNPEYPQPLVAASIWSGNIPDRFTQADTFGAMASTTQAFMSGDGSWTGSAIGQNGEINRDFIFPYPADWIGTLDTGSSEWTWQAQQWSTESVCQARETKYAEMYRALNTFVGDMAGVEFSMSRDDNGRTVVHHDPDVAKTMPALGGYHFPNYVDVPLALHISDRDYYSLPEWNHGLAERITAHGGSARVYTYPGNTHSLKLSKHSWFSPPGSVQGAPTALDRDVQLFGTAAFAD